jgi:hypothetical protein
MGRLLILISFSFLLFSCATRKVSITKSQVETSIDSIIFEKNKVIGFNENAIKIKEVVDEFEISPIDTSKPLVIEGKEYFNSTIKIKKTKREVVDTTKTTVVVSDYKQTEVSKEEKKEAYDKSIDKKPSYMNLWWLLLIPIVIFSIRFFIKK